MRRSKGRFGRPTKNIEENLSRFQDEWDDAEDEDFLSEDEEGPKQEAYEYPEEDAGYDEECVYLEEDAGYDEEGVEEESEYPEEDAGYDEECVYLEEDAGYDEEGVEEESVYLEEDAGYDEEGVEEESGYPEEDAGYDEEGVEEESGYPEEDAGYDEEGVEEELVYPEEDAGYDQEEYEEEYGYPEEDPTQDGEAYEDFESDLAEETEYFEGGEEGEFEEDDEDGSRILDKFILVAGIAVLLMALVTGIVFIVSRMGDLQANSHREVGAQLAGGNLIGEQGLDAVANAQQAYLAAQQVMATPEPTATPKPQEYDEQEYRPDINVQMNFSSIERDLKIKFVNKETGKLIGNVPFSLSVKGPDGTEIMWSDDDMDGIIYKKNLTPGQYRLVMNALTDEKYKSYGLVTSEQKTEVKKEIEYQKVDVSDEVKTESQVNVEKEDTKINETQVESYIQDTVAWVESTSTMINYVEVAKGNIPDPMTLALGGSFVRLSRENPGTELPSSQATAEPAAQPSPEPPAATPTDPPKEASADPPAVTPTEPPAVTPADPPAVMPTEPPAVTPTEPPAVMPTEPPAVMPTEPPAVTVTAPPAVTPTAPPAPPTVPPTAPPTAAPTSVPGAFVGRIDPVDKTLAVGEQFTITAACDGVTIQSITWTSNNPAAVTVDGSGTATAVAVTQQPVLITYVANGVDAGGNQVRGLTAACSVTVSASRNLRLDKATELVYTGASVNLTAVLENGLDTDVLTVESSDANVARAEISGRTITVTGLAAGSANITVKYSENDNTLTAACTVTVKQNPRENRTSLLKDRDGNELYVQENNNYRQAFYADYYTYDKFYKKGEAKYTGWQTIGGAVKYFDVNGNAVTGEQVIQGVKYNFASDGTLVTGAGVMGIDVSKWNGSIDWNAVKNSGVSYVIIRCGYRGSSQGTLIVDSTFQNNIKGATDAGLKVGVYFFTQAIDRVEAVEEASMVLELIKNYRISYPVFLDVEPSGGRADGITVETRTEVCKAFCQTIQNAGYTAGIYANRTWLTEKIDVSQLGAYKIWLAQYASAPTYTGRYDLWQYKSTGKVSGIVGDVDLNLSYLGY